MMCAELEPSMKISVAEAQGQLLELVRRAEAGEEVVLTHEGRIVAKLGAVASPALSWAELTPEARLDVIREVVANAPPKPKHWPDAAHSQDFLYDDYGLPA
jgi:antitoxin (DNA-binding transcriptional repressor) of toxin-antitoxin stability system